MGLYGGSSRVVRANIWEYILIWLYGCIPMGHGRFLKLMAPFGSAYNKGYSILKSTLRPP